MGSGDRSSFQPYAAALTAVGLAWLARWLLDSFAEFRVPYATFFVAVAWVGWRHGFGPALLSVVLGAVLAMRFFVPPYDAWLPARLADWIGVGVFVGGGVFISMMGRVMRVTERSARSAAAAAVSRGKDLERENAERRRAESEVRAQREWFRVTLGSIGDAVIATDTEGRVTFLNPVAEALTGWTSAEATGRSLREVFHILNEHTRADVPNPVEKALREGRPVGLANHTILIARDGAERAIDDSAAPILDDFGAVLGVVLIFRDVSERRRREREGLYLAAIVSSSDDAIYGKTLDGTITSWNAGAERLYGWRTDEIVGKPVSVLTPSDRAAEVPEILAALREGRKVDHFETVRCRKDGKSVHVSLSVSPIRNAEGELIGASSVARDITGRIEAEEALRSSEERLRIALEAANMGTWDWDVRSGEVQWSESLERIHGYEPGTFEGTFERFRRSIHPDDRALVDAALARSLETGQPYEVEYRDIGPDDVVRWMTGRGTVLRDEKGPARMVGVCVDVTARKELENELRRSAQALREADRRKDEFLATLAHELRNPLAPIRNALEIMRVAASDPQRLERARAMMERQVQQMVRLIDDLLDVSRISSGRISLRKERLELRTVVESAIETSRPLIEKSGHQLGVDLPAEPLWVDGDLMRLSQVFANLLNNAAKYTDHGRIDVRAERKGDTVTVSVKDTGVGIPPDALPHIFEMFSQVDRSLERTQGGLGIGLSLVRALVALHGGTVEAHSRGPGTGSEFVVTLPLSALGAEPASALGPGGDGGPRRATVSGHRILIVDDNRDSADSLALMLEMAGNETRAEYDGAEAVDAARAFAPHVVLLDIGLPGLNGYEVARRLRSEPWGRSLLLVAMTGWGQDEDKQRAMEAGFDLHMTKPLDLEALEATLAKLQAAERLGDCA